MSDLDEYDDDPGRAVVMAADEPEERPAGKGKGKPKDQPVVSAPDVELYLLASALVDGERLDLLTVDLFSTDAHQILYTAARRLRDAGQPIDLPLLGEQLKADRKKVLAAEAIQKIVTGLPTFDPASFDAHLASAENLAYRRQVIAEARQVSVTALDGGDVSPITEQLVKTVENVASSALPPSWAPVDLTAALEADHEPERPTLGAVDAGMPLLYAGRVNSLAGESGVGKGLVTLAIVAQELAAGRTVAMLDYEDTEASVTARLLSLDVSQAAILERFIYIRPNEPLPVAGCAALCRMFTDRSVSLVLIDTVGEAMAMDGVNPNADDEVARWFRSLPRRLAHEGGAAVCLLDHVTKPQNGQASNLFAIGSQRKRAALDGAGYMLTSVKSPSRGVAGKLKVTTAKDRHGARAVGSVAAMISVESSEDGDQMSLGFAEPERSVDAEGNFRPTFLMERISRHLEKEGPTTMTQVRKDVPGNAKSLGVAADMLVEEGWVTEGGDGTQRKTRVLTSSKPYRQEDDPVQAAAEVVSATNSGKAPYVQSPF